jgi:hypothetical protein
MNFGTSIVTLLLVVSMLVFANLSNTTVIHAQQIATKTKQTPLSSFAKLHAIKITSPTKAQEVPIGKDLTVSGIYPTGNATTSHCQVFVIANGVKPYQPANATGHGGVAGYSNWNFVLTSKYTPIKQGPNNKITAKYMCSNNPGIASFYSVNITGVANTTKQQQQNVTTTTNNNNTILTPQNKPVVFNNARSTIQPYSIYKNVNQSINTTFLGNGGIGNTSGIEYLGYHGMNNVNQSINTTFLGNGGIGNTSGIEYLGYHEPSIGSKNYSPVATGGSGSGSDSRYLGYHEPSIGSKNYSPVATGGSGSGSDSSSYNGGFGSGDSSNTDHNHKSKAPKAALHNHISSSYNGGFGSRSVVPAQQRTSVTMDDNTSIAALFPIGNNSTSIDESAYREGDSKFGFNIFPFD